MCARLSRGERPPLVPEEHYISTYPFEVAAIESLDRERMFPFTPRERGHYYWTPWP